MITKILLGVSAASLVALAVLFKMLMSAQEAKGALEAEISEAVSVNAAQTQNIELLQQDNKQLMEQYEMERIRAAVFTEAVAVGQVELEKTKRDHATQLAEVRDSLTVEERVCADSRVPDAYFMRGDGSDNEDGVPRSASTNAD